MWVSCGEYKGDNIGTVVNTDVFTTENGLYSDHSFVLFFVFV